MSRLLPQLTQEARDEVTKLLAVGFGLCLSVSAFAGYKDTGFNQVAVDAAHHQAFGNVGGARNSIQVHNNSFYEPKR
jgi:hypothetical protein